ncbi:UDP-sugar transporter protein SLC35A5 isoform 2-T2 [Chlamydotis macqueenii]
MKIKCCSRFVFCSKTAIYTFMLGGVFIALGSSRILLMKYSANEENKYDYLPTTVNICSEVVKLILCVVLALWVKKKEGCLDHPFECFSWRNFCNSMKWSIPAFLYFLDNLIVFYVLSYLQPAMAVLFSNFVIITTALLFRIVLKRKLSWVQWASLVILFLSIVALTLGTGGHQQNLAAHGFHHNIFFSPSNHCLLYTGPEEACLEKGNCVAPSFLHGFQWNVTSTMAAFLGLSVAFILKFRDNMFHVMTAQITTVIITTVSFMIFDFRPSLEFFLEAPVVLLSIFIYNASKPRGLEYATLRERGKLVKGDAWERSSGDGEEFERLNKPSSDIDTDEDSL